MVKFVILADGADKKTSVTNVWASIVEPVMFPLALMSPTTSNAPAGVFVPIPTFPFWSILNTSKSPSKPLPESFSNSILNTDEPLSAVLLIPPILTPNLSAVSAGLVLKNIAFPSPTEPCWPDNWTVVSKPLFADCDICNNLDGLVIPIPTFPAEKYALLPSSRTKCSVPPAKNFNTSLELSWMYVLSPVPKYIFFVDCT